jgi:hypothetical protein
MHDEIVRMWGLPYIPWTSTKIKGVSAKIILGDFMGATPITV